MKLGKGLVSGSAQYMGLFSSEAHLVPHGHLLVTHLFSWPFRDNCFYYCFNFFFTVQIYISPPHLFVCFKLCASYLNYSILLLDCIVQ